MDRSGAYEFKSARQHAEEKRRRVDAAVQALAHRYGLPPEAAQAMSDGIRERYGDLVAQKLLDAQIRTYRRWVDPQLRALAIRSANASGSEVSAYVADAREHAARMIRLEELERRNVGRGKAIEQASKVTWDSLSPRGKRKARLYLEHNALPTNRTRQPAREAEFLKVVAGLIERSTGHRISFSSAPPGSTASSVGRHHGPAFDVMMAAAEMADYQRTNEAMARRIQRIRRQPQASPKAF